MAFLADFAALRELRRLPGRGGKVHVTLAAAPPRAQHELLPVLRQIGDDLRLPQLSFGHLLRIVFEINLDRLRLANRAAYGHVPLLGGRLGRREFPNHRAARHLDDQLFAAAPGLALALAGAAVFGVEVRCVKLRDEIVDVVIGLKNDITTLAAVAAARPALGIERFMRKREATVAALAGSGLNLD